MTKRQTKLTKTMLATFAASVLAGTLSSAAMAQNNPVTRFDNGYLDQHPEVAKQLAANPSLVDNGQFMASHPGLREYLEDHPTIRADLKQHPYKFMSREDQLDSREAYNPPPGLAKQFDNGYLDQHPEVAKQLAANPSLVDNAEFMANHRGLHKYLIDHPELRADLKAHPYRFMDREDQLNGWREPYNPGPHPVANTDSYLDQHPKVAQQLSQNPRLIDNPQYVQNHPGLNEFLQTHPDARQEWKSHPYKFMRAERRYDQRH